jgi:hypothetical protein
MISAFLAGILLQEAETLLDTELGNGLCTSILAMADLRILMPDFGSFTKQAPGI